MLIYLQVLYKYRIIGGGLSLMLSLSKNTLVNAHLDFNRAKIT